MGSSALAAFWTRSDEGAGSTTVFVEPLDEDGNVGEATTLTVPRSVGPFGVELQAAGQGAPLAWAGPEIDELEVQPLLPSGELDGPPFEVPMPGAVASARILGTHAGTLLMTQVDTRLMATPLLCLPARTTSRGPT